jgi:membrane protease YdiL (CAAX protease family)
MEAPPRIDEAKRTSRLRWGIHLLFVTAYLVVLATLSVIRNKPNHPALSHTATGLAIVCTMELSLFALVFGLACLASRPNRDDLLLRWRGGPLPPVLGAAYSIGLRFAVGAVVVFIAAILVMSRMMSPNGVRDFAIQNKPEVGNLVDIEAMRHNPAYFVLTLTFVSFVVGGLREELWRTAFLAGMRSLWPRYFSSTLGQIVAVSISAVIFGLAHISMGVVAAALAGLLGLGLGIIMVLHRSIWPAVFAHGFFDATSLAVLPWAAEMMKQLPKH